MSSEPEGTTHDHPEPQGSVPQDKNYIAEKLRGAAVMYAPAIVLDLFEGISVLATAFGKLPDPQRSRAGISRVCGMWSSTTCSWSGSTS